MPEFARVIREARGAAGLTQAQLAQRSGIARPNIAAYESGSREPLFATALTLLGAAGARVEIEPPVAWSWTSGRRPYALPSRLWRLPGEVALRRFEPALHLWWSGAPRVFDLARHPERLRAYEVVLREGAPDDIEAVVDGVLLCEAWADLVLPRELRRAWEPLVTVHLAQPPEAVA